MSGNTLDIIKNVFKSGGDSLVKQIPEKEVAELMRLLDADAATDDIQQWRLDVIKQADTPEALKTYLGRDTTVALFGDLNKLTKVNDTLNSTLRTASLDDLQNVDTLVAKTLDDALGQASISDETRNLITSTWEDVFTKREALFDYKVNKKGMSPAEATAEMNQKLDSYAEKVDAEAAEIKQKAGADVADDISQGSARDTILQSVRSSAKAADDIDFGDTLVKQNNGFSATKVLTVRTAFDRATEQGMFKGLVLGRGLDQLVPVKSIITDSTEVVKPVIAVADGILEKSGLSKSLFNMDNLITKNANGLSTDDVAKIVDEFTASNAGALKAAQEEIHKLREHVQENFVTNAQRRGKYKDGKWVDGPDYARGSLKHDLTTEDKKALLQYLDSMENMIEDVAAGSAGKNGQEIIASVEKIKSGELSAENLLDSPIGLSRSGFEAAQAHIRLHGIIPGTDITVTHQWRDQLARQIDEGIYDANYYQLNTGSTGVNNSMLHGDNVERAVYNKFFDVFTARDANGKLVKDFDGDVQPVKPFVGNIRSVINSGFGPEMIYQINRMKVLAQAPGEVDHTPLPTATAFMDEVKLKYGQNLEHASETEKLYINKINDILSTDLLKGGGAKKEYKFFNTLRTEVFDNNRQNMHQAAVYAKNYELAFRFKNHDDLSTPGSIMINQWLKFKAKQYGAYIAGADSFKPGQKEMNGIMVNDYANPVIDWRGQRSGLFGLRKTVDADGNPLTGSAWAVPARSVQRLLTGGIGTRTGLIAGGTLGTIGALSYAGTHYDDENLGQNTALAFIDSATIPFQTAGKVLFAPLEYGGRATFAGIHTAVSDDVKYMESGAWNTPWLYQISDWAWDTANPWMEPNYRPKGSEVITESDVKALTDVFINNVTDLQSAKDASAIIHNEIYEKARFAVDFYGDAIDTLEDDAERINDSLDELIEENDKLGLRGADKVKYYTDLKDKFAEDVKEHRAYLERSAKTTADALSTSKNANDKINAMTSYDATAVAALLEEQRQAAVSALTLDHQKAESRILELGDSYTKGLQDGTEIIVAPLPTVITPNGQPADDQKSEKTDAELAEAEKLRIADLDKDGTLSAAELANFDKHDADKDGKLTGDELESFNKEFGTDQAAEKDQKDQKDEKDQKDQKDEKDQKAEKDQKDEKGQKTPVNKELEDKREDALDYLRAIAGNVMQRKEHVALLKELNDNVLETKKYIINTDDYTSTAQKDEALRFVDNLIIVMNDATQDIAQGDAQAAQIADEYKRLLKEVQSAKSVADIEKHSTQIEKLAKHASNLATQTKDTVTNLENRLENNHEYSWVNGGGRLFHEGLIKSGGKEGLLYQMFGSDGINGSQSSFGGLVDMAKGAGLGVWDWWQKDVKGSVKTQTGANIVNGLEVGAIGVGVWWLLDTIPGVNKMPNFLKFLVAGAASFMALSRTGDNAREMLAGTPQERRDQIAQSYRSSTSSKPVDGADKGDKKPENDAATVGKEKQSFIPTEKADVPIKIAGQNGQNVVYKMDTFKVKTVQGHETGSIPKDELEQARLLYSAQQLEAAVNELLNPELAKNDPQMAEFQKQIQEYLESDGVFDINEQKETQNLMLVNGGTHIPENFKELISGNVAANDELFKLQAGGRP